MHIMVMDRGKIITVMWFDTTCRRYKRIHWFTTIYTNTLNTLIGCGDHTNYNREMAGYHGDLGFKHQSLGFDMI